jgi:hypothetical protein
MKTLLMLLAIALLIMVGRKILANRIWPALPGEDFTGTMLRLGGNLVCLPDRSHLASEVAGRTTLICFTGFLEDARYFLDVHRDTPARTGYDSYEHFKRVTLYVGQRDSVLCCHVGKCRAIDGSDRGPDHRYGSLYQS